MTIRPARITASPCLAALSDGLLARAGWRCVGTPPIRGGWVAIGAPHTSNWDFCLMLALALHHRLPVVWFGKHTLFRGPLGWLLRRLGGVPVDRARTNGLVDTAVEAFRTHESLILVIAPEGTRTRGAHWKTGFWRIANAAGVPIVLGYVDWRQRLVGLGPAFVTTGDMEADLAAIRAFYRPYER